jgi:hypothetical protein
LHIHVYTEALPDTSDENLKSFCMIYPSSACAVNSAILLDVVQWFVKLHEVEESQILIRIFNEYFKMER